VLSTTARVSDRIERISLSTGSKTALPKNRVALAVGNFWKIGDDQRDLNLPRCISHSNAKMVAVRAEYNDRGIP
jgi:hypothetical protein